jgi:hypothetical protein
MKFSLFCVSGSDMVSVTNPIDSFGCSPFEIAFTTASLGLKILEQ